MIDSEGDKNDIRDFLKSQSVLGDFMGFLDDIAKQKVRAVNSSLFTQITSEIVEVITVKYIPYVDPVRGQKDPNDNRYPLNLTCQIKGIKLLKSVLKTQPSFDDSQKLQQIIDKLRHEIQIINKQS